MKWIITGCQTNFVLTIKSNQLVTTSERSAKAGDYRPLEEIELSKRAVKLHLKGLELPVVVVR